MRHTSILVLSAHKVYVLSMTIVGSPSRGGQKDCTYMYVVLRVVETGATCTSMYNSTVHVESVLLVHVVLIISTTYNKLSQTTTLGDSAAAPPHDNYMHISTEGNPTGSPYSSRICTIDLGGRRYDRLRRPYHR